MSENDEIQIRDEETEYVLKGTLRHLAEGLTGLATSSKKDLILSISHIFQRMRGGNFLSELLVEWNKLREKGKVKEDYQYTEQHKACLQELLDFLENDSPDAIRFNVLKQIFLVAASEELSNRESVLPQQYMKIARSLGDGEVIILSTIWNILQSSEQDLTKSSIASEWISIITEKSKMVHTELIEIYEQDLLDKRLLTPRLHGDRSGVNNKPYYRLSSLGYKLCEFINFSAE